MQRYLENSSSEPVLPLGTPRLHEENVSIEYSALALWHIISWEQSKNHTNHSDQDWAELTRTDFLIFAQLCCTATLSLLWSSSDSFSRWAPCSIVIPNFSWAHLGLLVLRPLVALRMMNRALPREQLLCPRLSVHLSSVSASLSSCCQVENGVVL